MTENGVDWLHNFRRMFVQALRLRSRPGGGFPPRPAAQRGTRRAARRRLNLKARSPALRFALWLDIRRGLRHSLVARACGVWTCEPRQGRKAATATCFAIAAVTLAPFHLRLTIADLRFAFAVAIRA